MNNVRCFFEKKGIACFTSHLDMMRAFSRAIFAGELPIWFTEGFHPHPYMVFGQPLPLGMAGMSEFLDIRTETEVEPQVIVDTLNKLLPSGITVVSAKEPVHKPKEIMLASFTTELDASLAEDFAKMWSQPEVIAEKKSKSGVKQFDLKKEAKKLTYEASDKLIINSLLPCTVDGAITPIVIVKALEDYTGKEIFARHTRSCFYLENGETFR